jgi:putative sigma-54 modulation protein
MRINVQSVNFKADIKLIDFIQKRLDKLDQFYDHVIDSDVFLKVINTSAKENKLVEVKINVPGNDILVKKEGATFEEAVDLCVDTLGRQLRKRKEKVKGL